MKVRGKAIVAAVAGLVGVMSAWGAPVVTVELDQVAAKVDPMMYGIMTEEINYSYDGGLYGELIRNRVFKDDANGTPHWTLVGKGSMALDKSEPLSAALDTSLKVVVEEGGGQVVVENDGYWGIPVKPSTTYTATMHLRNSKGVPVEVQLRSADGGTVYARGKVTSGAAWGKVSMTLTTGADVKATTEGRFAIVVSEPTVLNLGLVSLFPPTYNNRVNGNRIDLMEKLVAMKPAFLRFPGGNYLEGDTFDERFDWKKTIGDWTQRPGHRSPWKYRSTDGMGLLEFMYWIEEMKAEPILAVFAGYALRRDYVPAGEKLTPFVEEALEEIEYLTGDANTTKWGKKRAEDGHPKPFKLKYVEVGNEDWFDRSGSYEGRFAQFYDAIKAKYPELQVIATTPVKTRTADLIDEHYYFSSATAAHRAAHKYDKRDRSEKTKVFVGEWATRLGAPTTNMEAALADAAFMTGFERNADVVLMSCYAPLFVNVSRAPGNNGYPGMQWRSDLIGYDALTSYGSPSYWAQLMFNNAVGDVVPVSKIEGVPTVIPPTPPARPSTRAATQQAAPQPQAPVDEVYYSVTKSSATGAVYLKVVNISGVEQAVEINLNGAGKLGAEAKVTTLSAGGLAETNSIGEPERIVPKVTTIGGVSSHFTHSFPAYSVTVLEMQTR